MLLRVSSEDDGLPSRLVSKSKGTTPANTRTHPNNLPPIPRAPMIIKSVMTRTRAHDLCAESNWVDMRPLAFHPFPVCAAHPTTIIQRPNTLTLFAMPKDMELRYDSGEDDITDVKLHSNGK